MTPNRTHVPVAKAFLEAGFNVVCDKPLAFNLEEARALRDVVRKTGKLFALTHNYTGYPMVKEARELVRNGELGEILKVVAEYPQGWLIKPIDEEGQKQASWRTEPAASWRLRVYRRYRDSRRKSEPLHHRSADRRALRRVHFICQRTAARRRRESAHSLPGRSQGRLKRLANFGRRGEQFEHQGLWHESLTGMAPGRS